MCECGAKIEEIYDVPCDKSDAPHRHGKCPACERHMICVHQIRTVRPGEYH